MVHDGREMDAHTDAAPSRQTVFVVDDDAAVARSLARLLRAAGWPVETYLSAEAFLAARSGAAAGVLVLDVRLPGMSGPQLDERLRACGIALPTIFITAGDEPRSRDEALRRGARAWLRKPVDPDRLVAEVEKAH